jgi:hypothetical protein
LLCGVVVTSELGYRLFFCDLVKAIGDVVMVIRPPFGHVLVQGDCGIPFAELIESRSSSKCIVRI